MWRFLVARSLFMKLDSANHWVRFLLSLTVGSTGFFTPGLKHTHAGGASHHEHHAPQVPQADHPCERHASGGYAHSHGHVAHEHEHIAKSSGDGPEQLTASSVGNIADATTHVHVGFFGFCLTLPVSGESQQSDNKNELPILVRAASGCSPCVPQLSSSVGSFAPTSAGLEMAELAVCIVARFSVVPRSATALCDTARHERSGVQLA